MRVTQQGAFRNENSSPALKVNLINPYYDHFPGKKRLPGYSEPQVGLAYLAAAARTAVPDAQVSLIDQCVQNLDDERLLADLAQNCPDVIGFYSATLTLPRVGRIAERIKNVFPEALIVLGGPHISARPQDLPAAIDLGVLGEGEATFAEILNARFADMSLDGIPGTAQRIAGEIHPAPSRAPIEPLDSLPFPMHELLIEKGYRYQYPVASKSPCYLSVVAGRGCPFNCTFCAKSAVWGRTVRRRSPTNVVAELQAIGRLGVDLFSFRDDTFTYQRDFVLELCRLMIAEKLNMRWACLGRADQVDDEMAAQLAAAGCFEMHIGVETASAETLEHTNKKLRKVRMEEGFRLLKAHGIRPKGTFILGLPGENEATIRSTIRYAVRLDPAFCFFSCFIPYPGTTHYEEYRRAGFLLTDDYSRFNYHGEPIVQTPALSADRLGLLRRRAYRRFYLRPAKLWQIAGDLRREGGWFALVRAARSFLNVAD